MPETKKPRAIVIAGGGTGGHVFPGLAVAAELRHRHPDRPILWIGASGGMEARLVPQAGIRLVRLPLGGIAGKSIVNRAWSATQAGLAVFRCLLRFLGERPAAVLGVGGFASGPACLAARLLAIPLVIHEQNSVPGGTNRFLARLASAVAVSFPETVRAISARRVEMTGNPVRGAFFEVSDPRLQPAGHLDAAGQDAAEREPAAFPAAPLSLLVVGGSRGARSINRAMVAAAPRLAAWSATNGPLTITHQTGEADCDEVKAGYAPVASGTFRVEVQAFLDELPREMASADLVIGRSGASAVFELAAAGRASILIPFPFAAGDHQTANARSLVDAGAAELIADRELPAGRLADAITGLLSDRSRLNRMADAARRIARPDAAFAIANLIEETAGTALPAPPCGEAR